MYALYLFTNKKGSGKSRHAAALSILLSPGLIIVDHIHFQYNGFLLGILVLSIHYAEDRPTRLLSCILFAALLCFKHIFLYLAPAYGIFMLRAYVLEDNSSYRIRFNDTLKLAVALLSVFASAFGPFIWYGQMPQVFSRLFPFSRGLCHAYWAPNFWALYSFADRVILLGEGKLGVIEADC